MLFKSNAFVRCYYKGTNANIKQYFSPINAKDDDDGYEIYNMNLDCSNVRYGVHDEHNGAAHPYKNVYKKCSIKIDNTKNDAWTNRACICGGLGASGDITIEDCYFESTMINENYPHDIVSYHNGNGSATPFRSNIVITGCYFANKDGCRCSHYGVHDEKSRMIVSNCSLGRAPRIIFESSSYSDENMELLEWNNEIRN